MDSQIKGDLAELRVATELKKNGWDVLQPYSENQLYDIVAHRPGEFVKIQVKHGVLRGESVEFRCYSSNPSGRIQYTPDDIDGFAVYSSEVDKLFWVPIAAANSTKMAINTQRSDAKNPERFFIFEDMFFKLYE